MASVLPVAYGRPKNVLPQKILYNQNRKVAVNIFFKSSTVKQLNAMAMLPTEIVMKSKSGVHSSTHIVSHSLFSFAAVLFCFLSFRFGQKYNYYS